MSRLGRLWHRLRGRADQPENDAELVAFRQRQRAALSDEDRARVERLEVRAREIQRAAGESRHLGAAALQVEVSRLGDVIQDFIELALSARDWRATLAQSGDDELDSELCRYEAEASRALDEATRDQARKQMALLLEERSQREELRRRLARAGDQLEACESTFKIIANEIALMRDVAQLRGKLDDLTVGVRAVREATTDDPTRRD